MGPTVWFHIFASFNLFGFNKRLAPLFIYLIFYFVSQKLTYSKREKELEMERILSGA
jgi:hypothetical protein